MLSYFTDAVMHRCMQKMMNNDDKPTLAYEESQATYFCMGNWSIDNLDDFLKEFKTQALPSTQKMTINGEKIAYLDSAGALCLYQCMDYLKENNKSIQLSQFKNQHLSLIDLI